MAQEILDTAAEDTYRKLEEVGGNPASLPDVLQPIALLYTFQAMVDNGGFRYVFESDFPFQPPYEAFSKAYRAIRANTAADKLDKAVAFFPFEEPEKKPEARIDFMGSLDESHKLFSLGDEVCGDKSIWEQMETYVVQHFAQFETIKA